MFPFFTIPNFEVKAYGTRHEAKLEAITYAPIVQKHELEQYLDFANSSRGWLVQSRQIFDKLQPGQNRSSEPPANPFPPTLLCVDHAKDKKYYSKVLLSPCLLEAEWHMPLLQVSPPPFMNQTFHNIDLLTDPVYKKIIKAADLVSDVVFSHIDLDPHIFDFVFGNEIHGANHTHPHTLASFAVREGLTDGKVVGYVFGIVAWDKYVEGKWIPMIRLKKSSRR